MVKLLLIAKYALRQHNLNFNKIAPLFTSPHIRKMTITQRVNRTAFAH